MSETDAPIRLHSTWLFPDGRTIPVIAGADEGDGGDGGEGAKKPEGDGAKKPDGEAGKKPDGGDGGAGEGAGKGEEDLPDSVKEVLRKERAARREADKRANAAETKAKEYEDAQKSEAEKTLERAETAERERDAAKAEVLRMKVAARVGLPDELVDRLRGDSEEALEEDAKSLMAALGEKPGKKKTPAPRDGETPKATDLDAQIAAAEKAGDWQLAVQLKARKAAAPKE